MRSKVVSQTCILQRVCRENVRKSLNFQGRGLKFFMNAPFYEFDEKVIGAIVNFPIYN